MPKVLVTGGAGYIGSVTAHLLKRRGYGVVIVDDLSRGYEHNVEGLPFHKMHLLETSALADLLARERVDAVVHFAAHSMVGESIKRPEMYFLNNDGGSASLLNAMIQANVKRLVFSSTAAVYGTPKLVPIPEDLPYDPVNPYGESKVLVEKMLKWLDRCSELRNISLRYFNACGADPESGLGEEHEPETHLMPLLIRAVVTGEPMTIFGDDYDTPDGTCIRDYVHVTDLAEAHLVAIEKLLAGGASDVFNVGTGGGHSVLEVLRAVEEITGRKVPHEIGPRREGDPAALVANSDKLKRTLGWRPKFLELKDIVATAWQFEQKRGARRKTAAPSPDLTELHEILGKKSVRFGTFTLTSGQTSDVYVDCKPTTCDPRAMPLIGRLFLRKMEEKKWFPDAVGGLTMGADPIAFAIARESIDRLPAINCFIVRKERKAHGMQKVVEGLESTEGRKVVILDDVCTKGESTATAIRNAKSVGMEVLGAVCLIDRESGASELLRNEFGVELACIFKLSDFRK